MPQASLAHRYAAWIERRRWLVIAISLAIGVGCGLYASGLGVRADFSYLLPQSARSVRDLRAIEARARSIGTTMVAVEANDPATRRQVALELREQILALGRDRVATITFDKRIERQYGWDHRWLFADLADLEAARDALRDQIERAKLEANPLYVSIDDPPPQTDTSARDTLRDKLRDAEKQKDEPAELVSKDGRVQMMILRLAFSTGDVDKDRALVADLDALAATAMAAHPGVTVGVAGDAPVSLAEHDAILDGMLRATAVTVVLVMIVLAWFFRSALAIGALSWALTLGTLVTFAFARVALGYLNVATAFLSSIVIGNGINVGILVTARYLEELRAGRNGSEALGNAIARTIAGTFAAALTAAVAYASLMITVFRGFRHFGVIGGVGMLLCWVSGYVVLPAALSIASRLGMRARREAPLGRWLAALLPDRVRAVVFATLSITAIAGVLAARFLLGDPFESNFRNLRSHSSELARFQKTMTVIDQSFGQGQDAGFAIALPTRAAVAPLVARLHDVDRGKPEHDRLFDRVVSIDDLLPADQDKKLAVLAQIRELLSSKDIDALDDKDRDEALRLRPPDDLRAMTDTDIPDDLARPFIEADGSRGKLVLAVAGKGYEVWDAHDTVRFADNVRALQLGDDVHLGGASFVFADVLEAVLRDGPRATLASALGAMLVVLIVIGRGRYGYVTLLCGGAGTILMLGISAAIGLRVNFLDFVALPITIGIGIEYAANISTRARQEGADHPRAVLQSTGGAVFVCSYTTIVGYGSLLLSQNLGIRSFGIAAMLGELTCLGVAIVLAPSLLAYLARRDRARGTSSAS